MRKRLLLGVVFCVLFITSTIYARVQGAWANSGNMPSAVEYSVQVRLATGIVLVAGGLDGTNYSAAAQLYNPSTGTWKATGSMLSARAYSAAVVLKGGPHNGWVLVEGGLAGGSTIVTTAELYNPSTGTWSPAGVLPHPRYAHTATLLSTGDVMVTGGCVASSCSAVTGVTEIYNHITGIWTTANNSLNAPRAFQTATLLGSGKVLVVGGCGTSSCVNRLSSSEIFSPNNSNLALSTWTNGPTSSVPRYLHTATLLSNGKVLVAGGYAGYAAYNQADLYDPTVPPHGSFSATGPMQQQQYGRYAHTATALPNNTVLIAGGEEIRPCGKGGHCPYPLNTTEIYDVSSGTFSSTGKLGNLILGRASHTATLLSSNDVLVAGGCTAYWCTTITSASEIYTPLTLSISSYGLTYGMEEVGVSSATQTVTVTNVSHKPVLFTSAITASGDFSQTNTCPQKSQTLAVGANCTIDVTFKPTAAGTRTGGVTLKNNSTGSSSQTIALTGTGEKYTIAFTPNQLTLPSVIPGYTSTATATVTNDGAGPVNVSSISIAPSDGVFTITSGGTCPSSSFTLAVQQTCTISVTFKPPDSILYNRAVQVVDNKKNTYQLPLTGTGID